MPSTSYAKRKARAAARDRAESAEGKDIGPPPPIQNKRRRQRCARDLLRYLQTYHAESFPLPFSADHHDFIGAIQTAVLDGGAQAIAMPRGSGKTTIMLFACCWAIAYGHRRFVVLIAAEQEAADELCDDFRVTWETNDRLHEDFPEIAYPIRCLEGVVQRAKAQTCQGQQTHMRWSGSKLVMPTMPGSQASGSVVRARGLLSRLRGMKSTTPAGDTIRPDLVLVEDFQTDASAASDLQCAKREKTIAGAVLGLAGPGKRIAAFATCTIIRPGDAAARILNRKLYPKWKGRTCRLVDQWPDPAADKHWDKYQEIRQEELDGGDDTHPKATRYYRRHRKVMDAGAQVTWTARKFPHELSAIEHAINLRFDNPDTFDAEYQNAPKSDNATQGEIRLLTSDELCVAIGEHRRREVPIECEWVTAGIDVQKTALYYAIVAVTDTYSGYVIDYGVWPRQPGHYVELASLETTLHAATGKANDGAAIRAGLTQLTDWLSAQAFTRVDGRPMQIDRGLVDAGYQTQHVYKWTTGTALPYLSCMGFGVGAKQAAWDTKKKGRGERVGHFWRMPSVAKTSGVERVDIDTNTWKTTLLPRFALPDGDDGRWCLFHASPTVHRMMADHLSSEYPTKTSGRGRELFEWQARPGAENHLLDATLYAAVAANMAGARLPEETVRKSKQVPRSARKAIAKRAEDKRDDRPSLGELRRRKRKAS